MMVEKITDYLYSVEQAREIDAYAINSLNINGYDLMSKAAQVAFDCIVQEYPQNPYFHIVCGVGNNGGDGYVLAALAAKAGFQVKLLMVAEPLSKDAKKAFEFAKAHVVDRQFITETNLNDWFADAQIIVDALLGIGITRNVDGVYADLIDTINACRSNRQTKVFALDVPSGINADVGRVMGHAIKADLTLSFVAPKKGMYTGQGREYAGKLIEHDLQIPASAFSMFSSNIQLLSNHHLKYQHTQNNTSAQRGNTHKYDQARVYVASGNQGMMGAALLVCKAAYRIGGSWVKLITHKNHSHMVALALPELLTSASSVNENELDEFESIDKKRSVIAIGPGLGRDDWASLMYKKYNQRSLVKVVDADGLYYLSQHPQIDEDRIITPHSGEAALLLGVSSKAIEADRFTSVMKLQQQYGGVVLLKGAGSLICDGINTYVCSPGNANQATAGMGDVLTGMICGLLSQYQPINNSAMVDALKRAVYLHSFIADEFLHQGYKKGLMASDIIDKIPQRMSAIKQEG